MLIYNHHLYINKRIIHFCFVCVTNLFFKRFCKITKALALLTFDIFSINDPGTYS